LQVPTTRGNVWFKAAGRGTAFEVGLYELLQRVVPARVLAPIAIDTARGWLLLPDGGATLSARLGETDLTRALQQILPQYGELQRKLAPHVGELLSLGVTDMRAAIMPRRFEEALVAAEPYLQESGSSEERAAYAGVVAFRDTFVGWCSELAAAPVASSLDHNDLHAANILVSGPSTAFEARFYDWGDGVVSHPFASMLVALRVLASELECAATDPRLLSVRDAYLEVWSDEASHAELFRTLELACHVGKAARALTWARAVASAGTAAAKEFRSAPLEYVLSLRDGVYFGSA
jgi:hypothetical protein